MFGMNAIQNYNPRYFLINTEKRTFSATTVGKNFHQFSGFEVQRVRCHNKSASHRKMKVSKFADILQLGEKEFLSFPKKYQKISGNHGGTSPWYNNLQQVVAWSAFLSNMSATHCMQQDAAVRLHFTFHSNPMEE